MASNDQADILEYYQRELIYLREQGAAFARRYPRVAARMDVGGEESPDPHVERLIESFAFLTARLQKNLDSEFPEIPTALLGALYPHLVSPIPSMAIARLHVDPEKARSVDGFFVPDNTPLYASADHGITCRFRTCYPSTLWPADVVEAGFGSPEPYGFLDHEAQVETVLRVRLRCLGNLTFADIAPDRLRFHINADPITAGALYELIFNRVLGVAVIPEGATEPGRRLPPDSIRTVGFKDDEDVIPFPPNVHQAYRLLQEYFTFPKKFLFFDIEGLGGFGNGQEADLLFLLSGRAFRRMAVDSGTFMLGCTPVINLFSKVSEPIRVDQTRTEYHLIPDSRWERSTEIHSILKVSATSNHEDDSRTIRPFFSYDHRSSLDGQKAFWIARRHPSFRSDLSGTEMHLSFVDLGFAPTRPATQVAFAHTLCTNRGLAEQLPPGAEFESELDKVVMRVECLDRPTRQIDPPTRGETLWRLVSHLSLNHLSLSNEEQALIALKEILRLYSPSDDARTASQISGLHSLSAEPVVRRVGADAWRGFCRGTQVTLCIDEGHFVGGNAFLLASVLERFLPLYASINSFTQLVLTSRQRDGIWKTWPPRLGENIVL